MSSTDTQTTAISTGEILSTAQLRYEAKEAEAVLEEFNTDTKIIGGWVSALPERYITAEFGTAALSLAIAHLTDAKGDSTAIGEALTEMLAALDEADTLDEKATGMGAVGKVEGFTAK